MEKFRLISMVDFVLESTKKLRHNDDCEFAYIVRKYANFLRQPLTLGMFIPTDEYGNVIKQGTNTCQYDFEVEQQAKERVLFFYKPHFDLSVIKHHISQGKNIEYLASHGSIELTQSAIKQLGLSCH